MKLLQKALNGNFVKGCTANSEVNCEKPHASHQRSRDQQRAEVTIWVAKLLELVRVLDFEVQVPKTYILF